MTITADDSGALERSVDKTRAWIDDTANALGTGDRREAYRALNAVLHALRDGLTVEQAARLAAELPDRLRWAFYEGWVPSLVPATYADRYEFLEKVATEAGLAGPTQASYVAAMVTGVLERYVPRDEVDEVLDALPRQVRCLLELRVR